MLLTADSLVVMFESLVSYRVYQPVSRRNGDFCIWVARPSKMLECVNFQTDSCCSRKLQIMLKVGFVPGHQPSSMITVDKFMELISVYWLQLMSEICVTYKGKFIQYDWHCYLVG